MAEIINWIQTKKTVVAIGVVAFILVITSFMPDKLPYDFADIPENVDFNYHVRPILSKKCFACHGPDSGARKADLRLDLYETATSRGKGGKYIIRPGNANKSLLIDRISSADPSFHMPPPESKKTLSSREKAILHRWIEQGAEWKPFWAFIQPVAPKLPGHLEGANSSKVIDYLLNKAYQDEG